MQWVATRLLRVSPESGGSREFLEHALENPKSITVKFHDYSWKMFFFAEEVSYGGDLRATTNPLEMEAADMRMMPGPWALPCRGCRGERAG